MNEIDLMHEQSKVWIYQADKEIDSSEINELNMLIADFARQWTSHNYNLLAYGKLYHQRFLVLIVDETQVGVGGCSIDKSVHFVRQLENKLNIDFFNRQLFYFKEKEDIFQVHQWDIPKAVESGKITDDTEVFDCLVKTKKEFDEAWLKPFGESWHKRFA